MSEFRFALAHYAALVALAVLAYHLGRVLTRRLPYASVIEEIACSTSVGLGAVAYIVMALGVLDLLYTTVVTAVLVAIAGACLPVWIQSARRLSLAGSRSLAFIRARMKEAA